MIKSYQKHLEGKNNENKRESEFELINDSNIPPLFEDDCGI